MNLVFHISEDGSELEVFIARVCKTYRRQHFINKNS